MQIRPIRTESDHDSPVARIAELIGAKPDTAEGEELASSLVLRYLSGWG